MVDKYDFGLEELFVAHEDYILLEQENKKLQDEIVRMQGMIVESMGGEDDE